MLPAQPHIPQEEQCPVPEEVLGHLYRASKHGLEELVATVPAGLAQCLPFIVIGVRISNQLDW